MATAKLKKEDLAVIEQLDSSIVSQNPFKTRLSFHKIIEHWRQLLASENAAEALVATKIFLELENAPELTQPIDDLSILKKHKRLVDLLLSGIISSSLKNSQMIAIARPFSLDALHRTPKLEALFSSSEFSFAFEKKAEEVYKMNIFKSSIAILKEIYGIEVDFDIPMMMALKHNGTDMEQYYKAVPDLSFCEVRPLKPVKPLSDETVKALLENIHDTALWSKHIPTENFEFLGLVVVNISDVTKEEAYSRLKLAALERDSVGNQEKINILEHYLRILFGVEDLRLGIMGKQYEWTGNFDNHMLHWHSLIPLKAEYMEDDYSEACYSPAFKDHIVTLAEDLSTYPTPSMYEKDLLKAGFKSTLIAPLLNDDEEMVGMIELGSKKANGFDSLTKEKLKVLLPIFSVAVQRQMEDYRNEIDVLIKSNFTSIHPSVEWSFVEAAVNLKNSQAANVESKEIDPIAFHDVYPFFGQADIVGSSKTRNKAIKEDLIENLELAQEVLQPKIKTGSMPLLGEFSYRITHYIQALTDQLNSGDEVEVSEFLTQEFQPLLHRLKELDPDYGHTIDEYVAKLDPDMGVIYTRRHAYEDSLADINEMLACFVDSRQEKAQKIFPHYFERYNTDGIEYNMYLGKAIAKNRRFDKMFIENLRLWQLILMCEITQKVKNLQSDLKVPLDTAQLILVFSDPISIRFKMDEKQFDVDGAYNIRYEVIKKRIDKARVLGTGERMTVAGKVAIVYTHEEDKREYLRYIQYLQDQGFVSEEVEDLDIEPLQGVQGLKALRVTVLPNPKI